MTSATTAQTKLDMAILCFQAEDFDAALEAGARLDHSGATAPRDDTFVAGEQLICSSLVAGSMRLIKISQERGLDLQPYLKRAAALEQMPSNIYKHTNSRVLRFILGLWPDERWKTPLYSNGNTLLHAMANTGQGRHVKALVELGVSVDMRNARGQTALHLAQHKRGIRALLEGGADRGALDERNRTALHAAVFRLMRAATRRKSGVSAIGDTDLDPTRLLAEKDGLLDDPHATILARHLSKLRAMGLGARPGAPMDDVWQQTDQVLADDRRQKLGKHIAPGTRGGLGKRAL